jgi:hypothetical protein
MSGIFEHGAMNRRAIVGLFLVGCAAGAVGTSTFVVPPVRAGTAPQKWEYLCKNFDNTARDGIEAATRSANIAGVQGWEMSGMAGGGGTLMAMCFKRPLP